MPRYKPMIQLKLKRVAQGLNQTQLAEKCFSRGDGVYCKEDFFKCVGRGAAEGNRGGGGEPGGAQPRGRRLRPGVQHRGQRPLSGSARAALRAQRPPSVAPLRRFGTKCAACQQAVGCGSVSLHREPSSLRDRTARPPFFFSIADGDVFGKRRQFFLVWGRQICYNKPEFDDIRQGKGAVHAAGNRHCTGLRRPV